MRRRRGLLAVGTGRGAGVLAPPAGPACSGGRSSQATPSEVPAGRRPWAPAAPLEDPVLPETKQPRASLANGEGRSRRRPKWDDSVRSFWPDGVIPHLGSIFPFVDRPVPRDSEPNTIKFGTVPPRPVPSPDERANRTFVGVYAQPLLHQHHHQQLQQNQQQDGGFYPKDAVMAAVEECMRKQADALLHSLDGIGGRLSQLELYCYKLERSIGELRSDVMDYHGESTANFRCIDKNLRQVHKSVQILQDRQDLAETPNELSKLQIAHEAPSHKSEATGFSMLAPRESDHSTQVPKHEVALLPIHQVNGMQSPAVQVQSSNGFVLQHLVPVSLSAQHDQQQLNQAPVYYVQSQDHAKSTESKTAEPLVQVVQPLVQNPEARVAVELPQKSSHATELYPQPQNHRPQMPTQQVDSHAWHSQQHMVQQQQYIIQHVSRQMAQQQSSSPQSQSAPQVTPLYPSYCSQKPANANSEPISRSVAVQPPYSSPQQKHHEVAHSFYGQGNTILLPVADHNIQQQQPQSLQPHSQGPCPQPSQPSHCSVASYAVQGNGQTYSSRTRTLLTALQLLLLFCLSLKLLLRWRFITWDRKPCTIISLEIWLKQPV
ncbi:hypothetical protein SETIT_5G266300v2 [Setaria italica]|uniref:DUF1421 domain-containing protein n=1 Tax=Setaria italica TaxID=4555 RepID=A0A368R945_SETIT|nr:hypothetical protein SETIT_5G266300v2 [Setaria italica]